MNQAHFPGTLSFCIPSTRPHQGAAWRGGPLPLTPLPPGCRWPRLQRRGVEEEEAREGGRWKGWAIEKWPCSWRSARRFASSVVEVLESPLPQPEGPLDLRPVSWAAGEGHPSWREWEGLLWVGPCPPQEEELSS